MKAERQEEFNNRCSLSGDLPEADSCDSVLVSDEVGKAINPTKRDSSEYE